MSVFRNASRFARGAAALLAIALITPLCSCQKLAQEPSGPTLTFERSPFSDGIPKDYGRLVAAVPHSDGAFVSFWFERPDQSIVGVWVGTKAGTVGRVVEIPRK
jgi:hypothetical protein